MAIKMEREREGGREGSGQKRFARRLESSFVSLLFMTNARFVFCTNRRLMAEEEKKKIELLEQLGSVSFASLLFVLISTVTVILTEL